MHWASAPRSPGGSTRPTPAPTEMALWSGANTGVLTAYTPAIDIDITDPEAAALAEEVGKELFGDRGVILVRFGRPPKRTLPFRTATPFPKMSACFEAPNGSTHKIEILGDGQQFICFGIHPDTGEPYTWHGGTPLDTPHEELAEVTEEDMQAYLELVSERLAEECGFKRVYTNGHDDDARRRSGGCRRSSPLDALRRRRRQRVHPTQLHVTASLLRSWGRLRRDRPHRPRRHQESRRRRSPRSETGTGTTRSWPSSACAQLSSARTRSWRIACRRSCASSSRQKHDQGRAPYLVYRRDRGWQVAAARGHGGPALQPAIEGRDAPARAAPSRSQATATRRSPSFACAHSCRLTPRPCPRASGSMAGTISAGPSA